MRVPKNMYAVAAGALLMTLVGTAAMGAEQPQLKSNHTEGSEVVVLLEEAQTPFMAIQKISAMPMSDKDLSEISGQRMNLNFLRPGWNAYLDFKHTINNGGYRIPDGRGPRLIVR